MTLQIREIRVIRGFIHMKTLILIRHAKSSWDDPTLHDRERPLNGRGKKDAPAMGERLAKLGIAPDVIVSSPAVRALTTAEIIAKALDYKRKKIVVDERIYASTPATLLKIIHALDDEAKCAMLFGHNPEFSDLAHEFSPQIDDLPTCAVVEMHFDVKAWAQVSRETLKRIELHLPKKG
jgi:phosphohistidine phosphatase